MRLNYFVVKNLTLFFLLFFSVSSLANTMVSEKGIGINGVKSTFDITKHKEVKSTSIAVDFKKIISIPINENGNLRDQTLLETLETKVVVDDVVVFLQEDVEMEGLMVYNNRTNLFNKKNHLPAHSPG